MTADTGVGVEDRASTREDTDDAAADHSIVSEVSIASAATTDRRTHQPRASNGRFVRTSGDAGATEEEELPADRFLDREISWLQFNERVLQLAADENVPLLERCRYLAIFTSNLDEFFMVRVAGLKRRIATGIAVRSASGLEPREVLEQISHVAHELLSMQARVYRDAVRPALAEEGITIVRWDELSDDERERLSGMFTDRLFPVLTPLAVDPAHPFPYISGLSLNLAVVLVNPRTGKEHFARVKVPPVLPRLLRIEPGADVSPLADMYDTRFVPLEDVISAHLDHLFPGMDVREHFTFRVTRNEDLEVEEDDAENLLTALERELTRRRFGPPVRLEVEEAMDDHVLDLLVRELGVASSEVYRLPAPLDLRALNVIADLERSDLHFEPFVARTNSDLAPTESAKARDIFASIRKQDILLQHPYDSFSTSVQAFIEQAAVDPRVLAIKQTLYRTSGDSPIIDALIDAAEAGKQVLAVVEIKARFDEQNNISWARKLEHAGVHVVYGIVGLKTHAKLCLVIRQEAEGLRRYCHVGTGNYNPKTARLYEDLGLLTVDDAGRPGPHPPVQPALRHRAPQPVQAAARRPALGAVRPHRPHRRRDRARAARAGLGLHRLEGQLDRRRAAHRRPVPRVAGGRAGAPVGARHLRAAPGRRGVVGEHQGAVRARPLPRALAGLPLRGRRRARRLHRQRRHDAPQPRPPGRGPRAAHRPAARRRPPGAHGPRHGRRVHALAARRRRPVDAPPRRRGRQRSCPTSSAPSSTCTPSGAARPAGGEPVGRAPRRRSCPGAGVRIPAAGTLPWRLREGALEVALVHRPRYDDWSWAKGKLDPEEAWPVAAVRETEEETGLVVRLGPPLPEARYTLLGRDGTPDDKVVRYWSARVTGGHGRLVNEIDDLAWLDVPSAHSRLDYARDREQLLALVRLQQTDRLDTWPLVLVRHAHAVPRTEWSKDDTVRPLDATGRARATALAPVLAAYGVTRVVSSPSQRCAHTVAPFARRGAGSAAHPGRALRGGVRGRAPQGPPAPAPAAGPR